MGRDAIWDGATSLRYRYSDYECAVDIVLPDCSEGCIISFGFRRELQDGALVGEMMGQGRLSLKIVLHKKDDGWPELRGYTALTLHAVSPGSSDSKKQL
jgi:hypothetical protein